MELRTLLDWAVAYRLRSVPGVIEVNAMGGEAKQYQVVLDPRAPRRIPPVAAAVHRGARAATTRQRRRRLHRAARRGLRHARRGQFQRDRRHRRTPCSPPTSDGTPVLLKQRRGRCGIGPALRFGVVTKHGEGEIVAGTVMMLIGAELARGRRRPSRCRLAEIQTRAARRRAHRAVLRPRRVHRPHAPDGGDQPRRRARCWSSWCSSSRSARLRGTLVAALAIPLAMGDRRHRHGPASA